MLKLVRVIGIIFDNQAGVSFCNKPDNKIQTGKCVCKIVCSNQMPAVSLSVQARIHLESRVRLLETDAWAVSLSKTRPFVFYLILVQPRKRPDMNGKKC